MAKSLQIINEGLTYDDLLLRLATAEGCRATPIFRAFLQETFRINAPFISAAMDTVTNPGIGHCNSTRRWHGSAAQKQPIEAQAAEVRKR
ncbi:MAG: IMP dehydrogenase [Bacteroidetes bacterium]|nr:IMP dehydrogenase [Bacteroidota bacterium]